MRIGIDAHHINGKPQGSRTYLLNLVRELAKLVEDNELHIYSFAPEETARALDAPRLSHHRLFPQTARVRLPFVVPALGLRDRLDVFHSQYLCPPVSLVREVVSVHDILFETHPELFEGAFSMRSVRLIRLSARRARVVLTVSEFSRQALLERYRLTEEKVVVTPDGVDLERFRPGARDEGLAERYELSRPFVLSVGRLEPRKNLERLIRAFAKARERLDRRLTLVLVGARDFRAESVFREIEAAPEGMVRWLGPVPDQDLPPLYNMAEALAYPSLVEGFGMPVLEAMACGTPVVTAPRGALPEVGGDAVLWVEPENEDSIADGVERALTDTELRSHLRGAGPERARGFSWEEVARRTLESYRRAVLN